MKQFEIDGNQCTLDDAILANAHDEAVTEWLKTAAIGDTFFGQGGSAVATRLEDVKGDTGAYNETIY